MEGASQRPLVAATAGWLLALFREEATVSDPFALAADQLVEDALRLHPRLAALLLERGVVCLRCGEPVWGTLGETIARKGLAVEPLLRELELALKGA